MKKTIILAALLIAPISAYAQIDISTQRYPSTQASLNALSPDECNDLLDTVGEIQDHINAMDQQYQQIKTEMAGVLQDFENLKSLISTMDSTTSEAIREIAIRNLQQLSSTY